jgi:uncharacterized protein
MKRTVLKFLAVVLFLLSSAVLPVVPAQALEEGKTYIYDEAALLTPEEKSALEQKAADLREKYGCDVALAVMDDMYAYDVGYAHDSGDAYVFNKYLFEETAWGDTLDSNCLLLVLSMEARDYWLEPYGDAQSAFTKYGTEVLMSDTVLPLLGDDEWYEGFAAYYEKADEFLGMWKNGTPFSEETNPAVQQRNQLIRLAIVVLVPLLISAVVCIVLVSRMKTAKTARLADQYIPAGGFHLTRQEDMFLYRTETRVKRSSSDAGGSSSGSHGSGGKF